MNVLIKILLFIVSFDAFAFEKELGSVFKEDSNQKIVLICNDYDQEDGRCDGEFRVDLVDGELVETLRVYDSLTKFNLEEDEGALDGQFEYYEGYDQFSTTKFLCQKHYGTVDNPFIIPAAMAEGDHFKCALFSVVPGAIFFGIPTALYAIAVSVDTVWFTLTEPARWIANAGIAIGNAFTESDEKKTSDSKKALKTSGAQAVISAADFNLIVQAIKDGEGE